jgi:T-complex protein 1 subunit theta
VRREVESRKTKGKNFFFHFSPFASSLTLSLSRRRTGTSLGPNGLNKLIVNHLEKLFVTSDAATIMHELDVMHPAAKVITLNAKQQEVEVGDGINLVVVLAGELLQKAETLLRAGLHPSEIIAGYDKAAKLALRELESLVALTVADATDRAQIAHCIRGAIASKLYGQEGTLAPLVADACVRVTPAANPAAFNVDNVRVVKIPGGGVHDSSLVQGMLLPRAPEGTVRALTQAKIGVFASGIDSAKTETKGTVLIQNADELLSFAKGEEQQIEQAVAEIAASGVTCVVSGGVIGELAMHYLERHGLMVIKVQSKFDVQRLCRATGATPLMRLGAPTPEEMGRCRAIVSQEIGGKPVTIFRQDGDDDRSKVCTIIARGSTAAVLDDVERAVDDGVNTFKALTRDPRFVPGGGAAEIELARRLGQLAETETGLAQYAMKRFAEAFEVIPATLGETCGLDPTQLVADLYAAHAAPAVAGKPSPAHVCVDIEAGALGDATKLQIWDSLLAKANAIRLAADAAITILQVDHIIVARR